jgi:hypothetical protein
MFKNYDTERMRIDSSGNLLVGTTTTHGTLATSSTEDGFAVGASSYTTIANDGRCLVLNRRSADGNLLEFNKSGTTVGSIATNAGALVLKGASTSQPVQLQTHDGNEDIEVDPDGFIKMETAGIERLRIDASGQVGIGTSSPSNQLHLQKSADTGVVIENSAASMATLSLLATGAGRVRSSGVLIFDTGGATERMRIDSSGNVLVGQTSESNVESSGGHFFHPSGYQRSTRNGSCHILNRITTDGSMLDFQKNGTSVGSIGVEGSDLTIGTGTNSGLQFFDGGSSVRPFNMASNSRVDNAIDLGESNTRFKDLYLSGGVYLGGTGSANHLDDYEEGTWSPFWCNNAGQAVFSVNPNVNMARYIKIGRQVTASCYFTMPATFSSSGNYVASAALQIGGLPFSANGNSVNDYYSGFVGWYSSFASSYNSVSSKTPMIYTANNSNRIELGHANGVGHTSTLQEHAYNGNSGILLTISYLTTA